ncbi:hypothetical protein CPB84DRAFT_608131 [Gymnopilus junonius]|uniref:Uncharacterized protein n=1 Tax=Gymnopilus junonius TaxID=109634 RepID=A0A9P5N829_GYMJU|nr:hypothetical protein CPB84DRAFT_608131 [Gymnopilus junonius]
MEDRLKTQVIQSCWQDPSPGVINSLQLLTAPKGFLQTAPWAVQKPASVGEQSAPHTKRKDLSVNSFLMVAGVGQEHKLGRWLSVKEGGARNGALVVAFSPRTLA